MNFYLAPMEGITTYIYRNAYQKYYGGIDTYYTPFVANCKLKSRELMDVLPENNHAYPLIPQILTNQADVFLEIAEQLKDMGYEEVNLNLGCPSGTVVAKHRGAGFLDVPDELEKFLDIIYSRCPLPISIKTRLGIESLLEWEDLLKMYSKFPIKELIIHARTLTQQYSGEPKIWGFQLAQQMLTCPLCYNGDIKDAVSFERFMKECPETNAIMLGRGVIANPELPEILRILEISGTKNTGISPDDAPVSSIENIPKNLYARYDNIQEYESLNSNIEVDTHSCHFDINANSHNSLSDTEVNFHTCCLDEKFDHKKFLAFHDEILTGYQAYMSGDQPVLYKMKELWTFWSQHFHTDKQTLKKIRKLQRISEYKSYISQIEQW